MASTRSRLVIAATVLLAAGLAHPASARDLAVGAAEYRFSCAACHGPRGRGNGPAAPSLAKRPTDLTRLEEENDYVFPYLKVLQVIDGRALVAGHGTREMPVWGQRYRDEIADSRGPYGGEAAVRARIEALVAYVQSLQVR